MTSAADPTSSPRSTRATRSISSPWSHVVRGEHDPSSGGGGSNVPLSPSASPISSPELPGRSPRKPSTDSQSLLFSLAPDHRGSDNAIDGPSVYRGKKPVWNVPSNGAIESGSVMDTLSWPALSESTRSSPKSASSESLKAHSDGTVSSPQGSVISASTLKVSSNQNPNITQNTMPSTRHKSMKRGNSFGSSNGALPMSSSLPDSIEPSHAAVGKRPPSEPSPRALANKNNGNNNSNNWDHGNKTGVFSPQSHIGNEHQRGHGSGSGSGRRGSNGHNNYTNRDRGGYESSHRNFGRDVHMQQLPQQRGVRPYPRPPSVVTAPFIAPPPPPLRPFPNLGFPDFTSPFYYFATPHHPDSLRGVPFVPHTPPAPQVLFFPAADPQRAMLIKQIDYYFSPENLCKDIYLRQNMDEQGWVPISLIAGFNRVKQLTNNIQYILDTVQASHVVEVQGEKIRKRDDWMSWILNPADQTGSASGIQYPATTSYDGLVVQFQNALLDSADAVPNNAGLKGLAQNEAALTRSASGNLDNQLSNAKENVNNQASGYSDEIWSTRSLVRSDTV